MRREITAAVTETEASAGAPVIVLTGAGALLLRQDLGDATGPDAADFAHRADPRSDRAALLAAAPGELRKGNGRGALCRAGHRRAGCGVGMIWEAVSDADFVAPVPAHAIHLAAGQPPSIFAKQALRRGLDNRLDEQLGLEARLQAGRPEPRLLR